MDIIGGICKSFSITLFLLLDVIVSIGPRTELFARRDFVLRDRPIGFTWVDVSTNYCLN